MARRSRAREVVLQMLFQIDLNPDVPAEIVRRMIDERLEDRSLSDFAWSLYSGVLEFQGLLDERIQVIAPHWKLSRMAATDRNVLRLGAFELIQTRTPHRVVINEALELARKFGSDQSAQFVNGVLDKLVPADRRTSDPQMAALEAGISVDDPHREPAAGSGDQHTLGEEADGPREVEADARPDDEFE